MSERIVTQTVFIPPPIGGCNTKDSATNLPPTDAAQLQSFRVYDGRVRAAPYCTSAFTYSSAQIKSMFNWHNSSFAERIIAVTDTKVLSIDSAYTVTDITGAVTVTNGYTTSTSFNQYLFLANGNDQVIRISTALATANPGFTGPSPNDAVLKQVWSYKNRLYFVQKESNKFWYGDVDAITGALTDVDLSSVFDIPSTLLLGINWSANQGITTEEYNLFVSAAGEILMYSGDSPEAANWELVGRTLIPPPLSKRSFLKVGGDVIFYTQTGLYRMSDIVQSAAYPAAQFSISAKFDQYFRTNSIATGADPMAAVVIRDETDPFIYVLALTPLSFSADQAADPRTALFVMNYQTGAWSSMLDGELFSDDPRCLIFAFGQLHIAYYVTSTGAARVRRWLPIGPTTGGGDIRRLYATGWTNLGVDAVKSLKAVRLIHQFIDCPPDALQDDIIMYALTDFTLWDTGPLPPGGTSEVIPVTGTANRDQILRTEFRPGGTGTWYQFVVYMGLGDFSESPQGYAVSDILGIEVEFETGGAY